MENLSRKRKIFSALLPAALPLAVSAAALGLWSKKTQLVFVASELPRFYPIGGWLASVGWTFLSFVLWWLAAGFLFRAVSGGEEGLESYLRAEAFTFFSFLPLWAGVPPRVCTLVFLAAQAAVFFGFLAARRHSLSPGIKRHGLALAVFLLVYAMSGAFFSPASWGEPLAAYRYEAVGTGSIPTTSPLFKTGFLNAKFLSFCELDPSFWGGVAKPLTGVFSLIVPAAAFFLDLPAADVESFHRLLFILTFAACVLGSFGYYLFLFRGLRLRYSLAVAGGVLLVLSNRFFCRTLVMDYPVFFIYFLTLPYALYFVKMGFDNGSVRPCAAAGAVLALPFYVLAPHPMAPLIGLMIFFLHLFFLCLLGGGPGRLRKLSLVFVTGAVFALAAAAYVGPVFDALLRGEMRYFGHRDVLEGVPFAKLVIPASIFGLFSIALFFLAIRRMPYRQEDASLRRCFEVLVAMFVAFQFIHVNSLADLFGTWLGLLSYQHLPYRWLAFYPWLALTLFLLAAEAALRRGRKTAWAAAAVGLAVLPWWAFSGISLLRASEISDDFRYFMKVHDDVALGRQPSMLSTTLLGSLKGLEADAASVAFVDRKIRERLLVRPAAPGEDVRKSLKLFYEDSIESDARLAEKDPQGRLAVMQGNCYHVTATLTGVDGPWRRVHFTTSDQSNMGIGGGMLFNNTGGSIDGRFMTGFPPMHMLYYQPGYDFFRVGATAFPEAQGSLVCAERVLEPVNRRLLDVAGVDFFVVRREVFEELPEAWREGLEPRPYRIPKSWDPGYVVLENHRSYGLVYWAGEARYEDPRLLQEAVRHFRLPFYGGNEALREPFNRYLEELRGAIASSHKQYSIILEDAEKAGKSEVLAQDRTVETAGFIGNRAAFRVSAGTASSRLVFNTSALDGWKVWHDSRPIRIERANFAFLSVEVPAEGGLVWFEFAPPAAAFSALVSCLAFIGVLFAASFGSPPPKAAGNFFERK